MATRDQVLEAIYKAVDEVNEFFPPESRLEKSASTPLLSDESGMESLQFVSFITAVEQSLDTALGCHVNLTAEVGEQEDANPFASIGTLADLIEQSVGSN